MDSPAPTTRRRWVRVAWLLGPALAFVVLLGAGMVMKGEAPQPGDPAPEVEAPTLDGEGSLALEDLRGKPVLVNFWASWCVPCEAEAEYLDAAHAEYGDEIHFLGVNIKDARSEALAFVERYDVPYPQVRDEELDWYDAFGLTGQPETFLVDAEGDIVDHVAGPFTSADEVFRLLDVMVARDA
jgi:cytochrome c biogenesis protein CcmG/thiol:disulfide interchange protein DsbE